MRVRVNKTQNCFRFEAVNEYEVQVLKRIVEKAKHKDLIQYNIHSSSYPNRLDFHFGSRKSESVFYSLCGAVRKVEFQGGLVSQS